MEKVVVVFRMMNKEQASEVFAFLPSERQELIINSITDSELKNIIEDLFVDDAVDMLEELPATVVRRVMKNATPETRLMLFNIDFMPMLRGYRFINYWAGICYLGGMLILLYFYLALHRKRTDKACDL
jgi:hypothetical protein